MAGTCITIEGSSEGLFDVAGDAPPQHIIRILDNCSGQNKSATTYRFDVLTAFLFDIEESIIYLIPGHTHMRADLVVAHSNLPLRKRQKLYVPDQYAAQMNTVSNLRAEVLTNGQFYEWEEFLGHPSPLPWGAGVSLLKKHVPAPPVGFTKHYYWHVHGNTVTFRDTCESGEPLRVTWFNCAPAMKRSEILADLVTLGPNM
eukprot:gene11604-3574_t